jgi:hypothetical protein
LGRLNQVRDGWGIQHAYEKDETTWKTKGNGKLNLRKNGI